LRHVPYTRVTEDAGVIAGDVIEYDHVFVGDGVITHAQVILSNGALILPHHVFDNPLRVYQRLKAIKEYDLGPSINGITSVPNFIKFRPVTLLVVAYGQADINEDDVITGDGIKAAEGITNTTMVTKGTMI
jgi:hypothetical protein